ncbi:MAG: proton-conducting transporter membrane subunit [Desulfatitalea sp.]
MYQFFVAVLIVVAGGLAPLVWMRRATWMRAIGATTIAAGCLLGAIDAGVKLFSPAPVSVSVAFLDRFALAFKIDALSAFFLVAVFTVCLLAAVYSYHYMDHPQRQVRTALHYFFFGLLVAAMALVATADNIITFVLCWEMMSLASLCLVLYDYDHAENRKAAYLYAVFSQVGAMCIVAAFALIYAHSGSFGLDGAAELPEDLKTGVFVLALIGFGSKAGIFPVHIWLPHAHPAAPSHISAVMSGVMIKIGIYGILRLYAVMEWHTPLFGHIVLITGLVSGLLGVIYAIGQHDLKRLLAYHSMENVGIILMGVGVGMIGVAAGKPVMAVLGFAGALLHVWNHALFKSLLFMGAGMVLHHTGTRTMDLLGGLIKRMPITGVTFFIGALSISGLPPFNGFASEFFIYMGGFGGLALTRTDFVLSVLAVLGLAMIGGLALACFTKVVGVVFLGEPRSRAAQAGHEAGVTMLVPMLLLAMACVAIGVFPTLFIVMALKAVAALNLGYGRIPLEPFIALTGNITQAALLLVVVVAIVLGLRALLYRGKSVTVATTWGCGFTQPTARMQYTSSSYAASILAFFRTVAPLGEEHPTIRGRFPDKTYYISHIHDLAERHMGHLVVRPVQRLFDRLRWVQHGDIHMYIGFILIAIVAAMFFV